MSQPIVLYDISSIPDADGKQHPWSPSTWKARYALNIKGIPYKTVWVAMRDVQSTIAALGAPPTRVQDGAPYYTLPVIQDPNTNRIISDSWKIAQYLDAQYPQHGPVLFPSRSRTLQAAFLGLLRTNPSMRESWALGVPGTISILSPEDGKHYASGKAAQFALAFAQTADRAKVAEGVVALFNELGRAIGDGKFLGGDEPCFADVMLASGVTAKRRSTGEDEVWTALKAVLDGKWERYMQEFEKWQTVD